MSTRFSLLAVATAVLWISACSAIGGSPRVDPLPSIAGQLVNATGTGSGATATFDAPSLFDVDYTVDCRGAGAGYFNLSVFRQDGQPFTLTPFSIEGTDRQSGTAHMHPLGATRGYLSITSAGCAWAIRAHP